jgi:hypothetical protein
MDLKKINSSKRAQGGVFGMSFGMIVSIIMIVFFLGAAFYAIRVFLEIQKSMMIGSFLNELQSKIDEAWNAEKVSYYANFSLPSGIEYICFINLTAIMPSKDANTADRSVWDYIHATSIPPSKNNLYLYSPTKNYDLKWKTINHIDLSGKNPKCIKVVRGIVSIKIERTFENPRVKVS